MDKFIYVFNKDAKEKLLAKGYKLLKEDSHGGIYIFENNKSLNFEECDVSYIFSDTLTF